MYVIYVFVYICCFTCLLFFSVFFLSLFWLDKSESEVVMLCCCCYKLLLLLMRREVRVRGRVCDGAVLCCVDRVWSVGR